MRIFADGLFVSELSLVLRVWLYQLGLKNMVNLHVNRLFDCYYLFNGFVDVSVIYLEMGRFGVIDDLDCYITHLLFGVPV